MVCTAAAEWTGYQSRGYSTCRNGKKGVLLWLIHCGSCGRKDGGQEENMDKRRGQNHFMPEDILAENSKNPTSVEDILASEGGTPAVEDDWTMNLEEAIQRQTIREQRDLDCPGENLSSVQQAAGASDASDDREYISNAGKHSSRETGKGASNGRGRKHHVTIYDEYEPDDDSVLFEEEEPEMTPTPIRGERQGRKHTDGYRGSRRERETAGERERGMSRREKKEYEEFLAYKEQKERGESRRGRKKKHRVRRLIITLLVLILLVLPTLFILARMSGIMEGISTADIRNLISDEVKKSQETGAMAGYTNIALFGLDSTQQSLDSGNNRTDVMIIASINDKTGEVKLVSVYRDTYLDIGDGNYQKANAAYAYGGPEQAIKMLNTNLDLNITDYATIGFGGVADMIDEVGGIEIDVQQDEIDHLNNYQSTMAAELGKEYVPVTSTGTQTLNGLQATAYCRIRYTDGGDFKRTERQKEVLSKTFAKLKKSGPITMLKAANSLSSEVRTSLNAAEIASLALKAFRFNITETSGFPNEELRTVGYIGDQSCVIPIHLSDNVVWLHKYLFGDDSYQVSETVQNISNEVSARSGY